MKDAGIQLRPFRMAGRHPVTVQSVLFGLCREPQTWICAALAATRRRQEPIRLWASGLRLTRTERATAGPNRSATGLQSQLDRAVSGNDESPCVSVLIRGL